METLSVFLSVVNYEAFFYPREKEKQLETTERIGRDKITDRIPTQSYFLLVVNFISTYSRSSRNFDHLGDMKNVVET